MTIPAFALESLAGGGEMGERIRTQDWSATPLGPIEQWPQSLLTATSICLASRFPIILWWGRDLIVLYNDAYIPIFGRKHPTSLGQPGLSMKAWGEVKHIIGPMLGGVLDSGRATWEDDQMLVLERNGFPEEAYFTYSYSAIRDESGRIGGVFAVVSETTGRVISERRLLTMRELGERSALHVTTPDAACEASASILARNPSDLPFALIYLADRDGALSLRGASGIAINHPLRVPRIAPGARSPMPIERALASAEPIDVELDGLRVPGACWPEPTTRAVLTPLRAASRAEPVGLIVCGVSPRLAFGDAYRGFFRLVANHVETAIANALAIQEARERADALSALDRAKTAFFSNVSHEFRTPLTLMLGPLEDSLADEVRPLDPEQRQRQELIYRNSQRLLRLVNSLLDFSRIEAGRVQATYRPTDLAALTTDLSSTFRSAVERAGLTLTVECASPRRPVFIDHDMWEKIVLNLLSNAFKHTFQGGIAVRLADLGDRVRLVVEDTGIGIPAEHLPRLFDRFHRVQGAKSRSIEGTGIGLALVQELVRLHGGSVDVESVVDRGSRFIVSIPVGSAHLPAERVDDDAHAVASVARRANPFIEEALRWLPDAHESPLDDRPANAIAERARILVADDNADMRDYIVRLLSERWKVTAVADGAAALAAVRADPPDVVLSDVMMPELDGFGLLAALRRDPRTAAIPVILLSARAGEEARVEGMDAGADDYLVKPFAARELMARVRAHVALVRLRQRATETVRQREDMLRRAVSAARMTAWSWDPDADRIECTDNVSDIFGLLPGQRIDRIDAAFALVHPDDADRHRAAIEAAVRDRSAYRSVFRITRPSDGRIVWLEEHGDASEREGRLTVSGVTLDVTDRQAAELSLEMHAEELRRSNSELEQFAYVASHDLKEPLRMVSQYLTLLERRFGQQLPGDARGFMVHAMDGAGRMQRLIEDLLTYSRAGRAIEPAEIVPLPEVIAQIQEVLGDEIARSGARIEVERLPSVRFERTKIIQLFQNLVANAIKFRAPSVRPRVVISADPGPELWRFSVTDNGIGIDPEHAVKIFDVFQRLHGREAYPGTGIGLAICKRIVDQGHGRIWVEPAPGGGSRFVFTLRTDVIVDLPDAAPSPE